MYYNEHFHSTIFQPFQFEPEQKKTCRNESHEKETKHITLQLLIYYILEQEFSIGANMGIAKTKGEKQTVFVIERPMQCLLLLLKKNPRARGKHLAIQLLWATARLLVTSVNLIYLVDEFFFLFLMQLNEMSMLGESKVICFCLWCQSG